MGIQGLLPVLGSITKDVHLRDFAGEHVAVDGYVWLHRGSFACSWDLCVGKRTNAYVGYCVSRVKQLLEYDITPIVVFDGRRLPVKDGTEKERACNRERSRAAGMQLLRAGNRTAALEAFQKAVDVTPQMAFEFILELRKMGVEYVVAPYEADAQLAHLFAQGVCSLVITEDSDLLPFGVTRVLFKLGRDGAGKLVEMDRLPSVTGLDFVQLSRSLFLDMCILAGCDYTPAIRGMGVRKAHRMLLQHRSADQVLRMIHLDPSLSVPPGYEECFRRARLTFLHQTVFSIERRCVVPLHPYPSGQDAMDFAFAGPWLEPSVAQRIAQGEIDPFTLSPFLQDAAVSRVTGVDSCANTAERAGGVRALCGGAAEVVAGVRRADCSSGGPGEQDVSAIARSSAIFGVESGREKVNAHPYRAASPGAHSVGLPVQKNNIACYFRMLGHGDT